MEGLEAKLSLQVVHHASVTDPQKTPGLPNAPEEES